MAISFLCNGVAIEAAAVPPSTTVLDYLRERAGLKGTKEGCAEGDCGACTVVRVLPGADGARYEAVNACLMMLSQIDGCEILTAEGLDTANGNALAPIQAAMADGDGTQCGFCTPGFVTALFALSHSGETITDATIHDALAGNLCRCTGYRPIVDAARAACSRPSAHRPGTPPPRSDVQTHGGQSFHAPRTLSELTALRARHPDAMLLAGGTDLGLLVSKERRRPVTVIHTADVEELRRIEETDDALILGAAVTYTEALPLIDRLYPSFATLIRRIGSRQIRNLGTIGGNVGNASPIGDTPPCLIALGASLTLASSDGEREIDIDRFFLDYRKTDLRQGEVIRSIRIPRLAAGEAFRTYKISKRHDQDISAVIGAFRIAVEGERVAAAGIAFGGMAATPKRAAAAERSLAGGALSEAALLQAAAALPEDFSPISDHRASSNYRMMVARNLFVRLYRDIARTELDLEVVAL